MQTNSFNSNPYGWNRGHPHENSLLAGSPNTSGQGLKRPCEKGAEEAASDQEPLKTLSGLLMALPGGAARLDCLEQAAGSFDSSIPPGLKHPVDRDLFALIFGDGVIPSRYCKGGRLKTNLEWMRKVLEQTALVRPQFSSSSDQNNLSDLIKEYGKLAEVAKLIDDYRGKDNQEELITILTGRIANLEPREVFLFPGGWQGNPGHTVLIEVRKSGSAYDLRIINSGGGIVHHSSVETDKHLSSPEFLIADIDSQAMTSRVFWKALIDFSTTKFEGSDALSPTDFYCKLISLLGGTFKNPYRSHFSTLIVPQRGGTCSWKSLTAYLKVRLGTSAAKRLILQIKFWTLINYCSGLDKIQDMTQCALLEKAAMNLAKKACQIYLQASQVNEFYGMPEEELDDYVKIYAYTSKVMELVNRYKAAPIYRKKEDLLGSYEIKDSALVLEASSPVNLEQLEKVRIDLGIVGRSASEESGPAGGPLQTAQAPSKKSKKGTNKTDDKSLIRPEDPRVSGLLENLKDWYRYASHSSSDGCETEKIHQMLRLLPSPLCGEDPFWDQVHEPKALIACLKKFACLMLKKPAFSKQACFIDLYHLVSICDKLVRRCIKASLGLDLERFGITIPLESYICAPESKSLHWEVADYQDQVRLLGIGKYFKERNQNTRLKLFDYPEDHNGQVNLALAQHSLDCIADFMFIKDFLGQDPGREAKLAKEFLKSASYSTLALATTLFTTQGQRNPLPQEYFDLRDLAISLKMMVHCFKSKEVPYKWVSAKTGGFRWEFRASVNGTQHLSQASYVVIGLFRKEEKQQIYLSSRALDYHITEDLSLFQSLSSLKMKEWAHFTQDGWVGIPQNDALCGQAKVPVRSKTQTQAYGPSLPTLMWSKKQENDSEPELRAYEIEKMIDIRNGGPLRIPLCLEFYNRNLNLLEHSGHFQFLRHTLLELGALISALKAYPSLGGDLQSFCLKAIAFFTEYSKKLSTVQNVYQLVNELCPFLGDAASMTISPEVSAALLNLLKKSSQSDVEDVKKMIALAFGAFNQHSPLTPEALADILTPLLKLQIYDEKMQSFEPLIKPILDREETRSLVLSRVAKNINPASSLNGAWQGTYPEYRLGTWKCNIVYGILKCEEEERSLTIDQIKEPNNIRDCLPECRNDTFIEKNNVIVNDKGTVKITTGGGFASTVLKKIDEKWYLLCRYNSEQFLYKRGLTLDDRFYWISVALDGPHALVFDKKGNILYRLDFLPSSHSGPAPQARTHGKNTKTKLSRKRKVENNGQNYSRFKVVDSKEGLLLYNSVENEGSKEKNRTFTSLAQKISTLFAIGQNSKMDIWVKKGSPNEIKKVVLVDLGLTFDFQDGIFGVREHFGCQLAGSDAPRPFQKFSGCLVLENGKGELLVIVPKMGVRHEEHKEFLPFDRKVVLGPTFEYSGLRMDGNREKKISCPYYIYEFDRVSGTLFSSSLEARLQLALIYTAEENYHEAAACLKKCWKDEPYSNEELRSWDRIWGLATGWNTLCLPQRYAIALLAAWLLLECNSQTAVSATGAMDINFKQRLASFKNVYESYLDHLGAIPADLQLTYEQEMAIAKRIAADSKQFTYRQEKISSSHAHFDLLAPPDLFYQDFTRNLLNSRAEKALIQRCAATSVPPLEAPSTIGAAVQRFIREPLALTNIQDFVRLLDELFSDDIEISMRAKKCILFYSSSNQPDGKKEDRNWVNLLKNICTVHTMFKRHLLTQHPGGVKGKPDLILEEYNHFMELNQESIANALKKKKTVGIPPLPPENAAPYFTAQALLKDLPVKVQAKGKRMRTVQPKELTLVLTECNEEREKLFSSVFGRAEPAMTGGRLSFLPPKDSPLYRVIQAMPLALNLCQELENLKSVKQKSAVVPLSGRDVPRADLSEVIASVQSLHSRMLKRKQQLDENCEGLKGLVLKLANSSPIEGKTELTAAELQYALYNKLEVIAGKKTKVALEELVLLILKKCWHSSINKMNPSLTIEQIEQLHRDLLELMLYGTESRTMLRGIKAAEELLNALSKGTGSEQSSGPLFQKLAGILLSEHPVNVLSSPEYLAFEYINHLMLRPKQASVLHSAVYEPANRLYHLMMGEGKTALILPGVAAMSANEHVLPVVVVPSSLKNQNIKDLKNISEKLLNQKVYSLSFDRQSNSTKEGLSGILDRIQKARREKGLLVTTPDTLQALVLKYEELCLLEMDFLKTAGENDSLAAEVEERRNVLGKILEEFINHSRGIIDEAHVLLKCMHELNFTLNESQALDREVCETAASLYKGLMDLGYELSAPIELKQGNHGSDARWAQLKHDLVHRLYPEKDQSPAREYLLGINKSGHFITDLHKRNPHAARHMAFVKEQLWSFLPHTLSKRLNVHYGKSPKTAVEYAIPYLGNNTPSEVSEFGHPHIMLNFTLQMLLQEGLSLEQFTKLVASFQKKRVLFILSGNLEAIQHLTQSYFGEMDVSSLNFEDLTCVRALWEKLKYQPQVILNYTVRLLSPQLKFHPAKLNGNAQDLGAFLFKRVIAITGTPYNLATYPLSLNDAFLDNESSAQLFIALDSPRNSQVDLIEKTGLSTTVAKLKDIVTKDPNKCALIDLGAHLHGVKNSEAAAAILEALPHLAGVVYFDDLANEKVILKHVDGSPEPYTEGQYPLDRIFSYFDQVHSFGADITQHPNASGIVTVNAETCLFQLLQAAKRMRLLEYGQSVSFLLPASLANQIWPDPKQGYDLSGLFLFTIVNQAAFLEKEIITSTFQKLKHLKKKQQLLQSLEPSGLGGLSSLGCWIDRMETDPFIAYSAHESLVEPEALLRSFCLAHEIEGEEAEVIIQAACSALPKLISSKLGDSLSQEVQKQEEKSVLLENHANNSNFIAPYVEDEWDPSETLLFDFLEPASIETSLYSFPDGKAVFFKLNDIWQHMDDEPIFLDNILVTKNFIRTAADKRVSFDVKLKPVDYFVHLICQGESDVENLFFIISLNEAKILRQWMAGPENASTNDMGGILQMSLCNISGQVMSAIGEVPIQYSAACKAEKELAQVQLMVLDGREYLPKEMEAPLAYWGKGREEFIIKSFGKIHGNRGRADDYGSGNLFKVLGGGAGSND